MAPYKPTRLSTMIRIYTQKEYSCETDLPLEI